MGIRSLVQVLLMLTTVVNAQPGAASPIPKQGPGQQIPGPPGGTLIAREGVDGVLEGFRKINAIDGAPRVAIYVNRVLAEPGDPAKATGAKIAPELVDEPTTREIERLFGRVFRHGGAQLAGYAAAAALLPQEGESFAGGEAAKRRDALAEIADVVVEVRISRRNLIVPEGSDEAVRTLPDIRAIALRLKDAAIVGRASSSDVLGRSMRPGGAARRFDASGVMEATALALIEDMLARKK